MFSNSIVFASPPIFQATDHNVPPRSFKLSYMARYRYPEVGHVYRHCLVCGRPFRIFRSVIKRRLGGKFCTRECYRQAMRAFSEALASDLLGPILGRAPQKAKGAVAEPGEVWSGGIRRLVDARTGFSSVVPARTRADVPVGLSRRHKVSDEQYPA